MKVRAIKEYFDKEKKKTIKPNTVEAEFEVNEERGGVLLAAGVVEDITEETVEQTETDQENTEAAGDQTEDAQENTEAAEEQTEDAQENTEAAEEQTKKPSKKKAPKNEQ